MSLLKSVRGLRTEMHCNIRRGGTTCFNLIFRVVTNHVFANFCMSLVEISSEINLNFFGFIIERYLFLNYSCRVNLPRLLMETQMKTVRKFDFLLLTVDLQICKCD